MTTAQFDILEKKLEALLSAFVGLEQENARLKVENLSLLTEREQVRVRLDAVLEKLEGI